MFFWFAMSIQNASRLEPAPMSQEIRLKWHNLADLKRKESFISQARGDCVFNVTRVDDHPHEQFFINFEFFVSLNQSKDYLPPSRVTHTGLIPLTTFNDKRKQIATRAHQILLKGFSGSLWVQVTKIIGYHNDHAVFISYSPVGRK
jgi:hypothetical protein